MWRWLVATTALIMMLLCTWAAAATAYCASHQSILRKTHATRACSLWFAISFLIVLIPTIGSAGRCYRTMLAIIVILFSIPSDKTCPICHFCSRRQCMCAANHLTLAKTDRLHLGEYLSRIFFWRNANLHSYIYECGKNRLQRRANHELPNGAPHVADYTSYEYTELANG